MTCVQKSIISRFCPNCRLLEDRAIILTPGSIFFVSHLFLRLSAKVFVSYRSNFLANFEIVRSFSHAKLFYKNVLKARKSLVMTAVCTSSKAVGSLRSNCDPQGALKPNRENIFSHFLKWLSACQTQNPLLPSCILRHLKFLFLHIILMMKSIFNWPFPNSVFQPSFKTPSMNRLHDWYFDTWGAVTASGPLQNLQSWSPLKKSYHQAYISTLSRH